MCRFSLGVAALALAASGALAQNTGLPGPEQDAQPNAERRGGPPGADRTGDAREQREGGARARDSSPPAIELRPSREVEPQAQRVVSEILSSREDREATRERRETRSESQPATERPARGETGLRDLFSRGGTERVLERMVSGPLDRSVRMLADCPRGLARTGGCEAPGQAQQRGKTGTSLLGTAYSPLLFGLTGFDPGRYLYRDGYLMQLADGSTDRGTVAGYIPLLGGALASGSIWPGAYGNTSVPAYLVDFFNLGQPGSYRYADNTLYRVDAESGAIQSVAALLTDEEFEVGEPMPAGYDVYNVPYPYRDRYADSAAATYRYADGYVYRVDRATRLIAAAIDLLT